jgi:hypothetical protein
MTKEAINCPNGVSGNVSVANVVNVTVQ